MKLGSFLLPNAIAIAEGRRQKAEGRRQKAEGRRRNEKYCEVFRFKLLIFPGLTHNLHIKHGLTAAPTNAV
ncbi:MAG: hypothetical protein SWX82_29575 [Cyanobacteriota bacterium]|nr:hypothetical protein [Cyanobacteriota bacterium]